MIVSKMDLPLWIIKQFFFLYMEVLLFQMLTAIEGISPKRWLYSRFQNTTWCEPKWNNIIGRLQRHMIAVKGKNITSERVQLEYR